MPVTPGQPSQPWWDRAVRILSMIASPARPCAIEAAAREHGFDPVWLQEVKEWMDINLPDCVDAAGGVGPPGPPGPAGPAGEQTHTIDHDFVYEGSVDDDDWEEATPTEAKLEGTEHLVAYNGVLKRVAISNAEPVAAAARVFIDGVEVWQDVTGPSGDKVFTGLAIAVAIGSRVTCEIKSADASDKVKNILVRVYQEVQ